MMDLLTRLEQATLLRRNALEAIIRSAPYRYKVYGIPKKNGNGERTIAHPAKEVKLLQRFIIKEILADLPVHPCATAYKPGSRIAANAAIHAGNQYLTKLDLADFFPSIGGDDFRRYMESKQKERLETADIDILVRILFWKPKGREPLELPVGAPTSPMVSNAIMFAFDSTVHDWCNDHGFTYTRYADDMFFSTNEKGARENPKEYVSSLLHQLEYPRLRLNPEKTLFCSKAGRRVITGLIIANDGRVSLGRSRKRCVSSLVHKFITGKLADGDEPHLRGMLAFANDVEPDFISRLERKYGPGLGGLCSLGS